MRVTFSMVFLAALALETRAADPQLAVLGNEQARKACVPCHSLRLVESQRLSPAAWEKEINKMIGWGAPVSDRELLLKYLSEEYSDQKALPRPQLTGDGSKLPGRN